ncbi:MAG: hypothetical protein J6W10_04840 [Kiritimatiellae bacterium]|nr:hypothetical protein [Kiritimatiellia bacterium]
MADIGAKIAIDGEKQFRQELANITQAGKTLSAQMDSLTSSFDKTDASEEEMSKVSKKLSEQIENQRKLVDKLQEAVQRSSEKTGENSTATLKWKEKLAKAETELGKLERQADGAGKELNEFTSEEKNATNQTSIFADMLKANLASEAIKKGVSALAGAVKDVAKFFVEAVTGAAEYADEVNALASTTGMSTEAIQEYKYAADLLDVSFETIQGSLTKVTRNMANGSEAFERLGIAVRDQNGELRDANEVFDEAIQALGYIDNETERDAIAMDLFGKSAKELNPLIDAGAKKLGDLREEAHRVGAVMSDEALAGASEFQDGLDRLKGTWEALKRTLGANILSKVMPYLEKFVGLFQNLAETGNLDDFVDGVVEMADDIISKIPQITEKLISALPKVIKSLTKALTKLLPNLAKSIGEILGQLFSNLPELLSAGLELGWALIKGVVMAIPEMISGIVDALTGRKLSEAAQACKDKFESIKKSIEEIPTATERIASALDEMSVKFDEAGYWVKVFEQLEQKTNPTAADLELINTAAGKLNELFPELGLAIDEDTGKWNLNASAIRKTIQALRDRYEAEAYFAAASETRKEAKKQEAELRGLSTQAEELQNKLLGAIAARDALYDEVEAGERSLFDVDLMMANHEIEDLQDQLSLVNGSMVALDKSIVQLNDDADYLQAQGMARLTEAVEKENKAVREATHTMLADGKKLGENYTLGIVEGMDAKRSYLFDRARKLMHDTVAVMKDDLQIRSPSRVMEDVIGKNMALGVVKGWEDVFSKRNALSMQGVVGAMRSTTNTMNLGGVSVNVYAHEGQDANAIATMVMRRMQGAVDARKAVFA